MDQIEYEWIKPALKALKWFTESMGDEEWIRRRKGIVDYFKESDNITLTTKDVRSSQPDKLYRPIAVYDDWIAWYMYLVESVELRPSVDEPFQSARIYPFFAAIGRQIDKLRVVPGVDDRLKEMLNNLRNQPDSTLFELSVAALYLRNGWSVRFLKERLSEKTPDFEVTRNDKTFWVECKRLAKVPDFANEERADWQKRFQHLGDAMQDFKSSVHAEVIFNVPIADVPEKLLSEVFADYSQTNLIQANTWFTTNMINFRARVLDTTVINSVLDAECPRLNSPSMIKAITGEYDMHGSYTQLINYSKLFTVGPEVDDGLHVLNKFCEGINAAYSAKYKSVATSSVEKKAKDVRKVLKKAVEQITGDQEGIIHIGYETVMGPEVELVRHKKTKEIINGFDFEGIKIEAIYCHALQPLVKIGEFECAETTLYFEQHPGDVLDDNLLLDPPELKKRNTTHWEEDLDDNIEDYIA